VCEHGLIAAPGRALILPRDLPKKPNYLPPLAARIDQSCRGASSKPDDHPGPLRHARTGLRAASATLERNAYSDQNGKSFSKCRYGKLNNERLVPLDDAALAAVAELQRRARQDHPYLVQAHGRPIATTTTKSTLTKIGGI